MSKAILFDLDGTLTDSGEGIINCAALALEHFGLPVPDRQTMRIFVGPPLRDTFVRLGVPASKAEEAIAIYRSRYIPTGIWENSVYPGIPELLETLKKQGYRLFVATSKPEGMATAVLERFKLAHYFEQICGATMDKSRDSKEAVIACLLEQIRNENAVMVGDTHFDVLGAAAHGIPTIGVSWGYGSIDEMRKAGAIAIADTPEALALLLSK